MPTRGLGGYGEYCPLGTSIGSVPAAHTASAAFKRRGGSARQLARDAKLDKEEKRVNAKEWIAAYASQLGTEPPTADELKAILELAAEAAHASERIAAPVASWLSAKAGRSLEESLTLARGVTQPPGA